MSKKQQYGRQVMRMNKAFEAKLFPGILSVLRTMSRGVISALKRGGYQAATQYLSGSIGNPLLATRIKALYRTVGVKHANMVYTLLDAEPIKLKRFGFNQQWATEVERYLAKFLLEKVTFEIDANQRAALLKYLTQGISDGLNIDEMVARLQADDGWIKILRYRTARIVRTEIKRAGEVGGKVASDAFDFEQNKEWIAINDNRVRGKDPQDHADHWHMNGQTVDAGEKFKDPRSGAVLMFPGDPEAPAGDTINCRCTTAYVAKRDANGRMIPKRRSTSVLLPAQQGQTTTRRRVSVIMPN